MTLSARAGWWCASDRGPSPICRCAERAAAVGESERREKNNGCSTTHRQCAAAGRRGPRNGGEQRAAPSPSRGGSEPRAERPAAKEGGERRGQEGRGSEEKK